MGLFSSLTKGLTNFITGGDLFSSALDIGSSLFGADRANSQAQANSATQWNREYGAYKTRYQDTVADMKAAGLNPILAASGGFNVGSGPSASTPATFAANVPTPSSSALNVAQTKKAGADTGLSVQKAKESIQSIAESRSRQGLMSAQEGKAIADMFKAEQEFAKITAELDKIGSETVLNEQQALYVRQLRKKAQKDVEMIVAQMSHLKKISNVYDQPFGKYLAYIEAITKSIGLNIGSLTSLKRR